MLKVNFVKYLLPLVFSFIFHGEIKSQNEESTCGWTEDIAQNASSSASAAFCFDVDQVLLNCTPVYVRINFHFFTDTDCDGNIQITNSTQTQAFRIAENLLNEANGVLSANQVQWHVTGAVAICNPIRYVLSGVYIQLYPYTCRHPPSISKSPCKILIYETDTYFVHFDVMFVYRFCSITTTTFPNKDIL